MIKPVTLLAKRPFSVTWRIYEEAWSVLESVSLLSREPGKVTREDHAEDSASISRSGVRPSPQRAASARGSSKLLAALEENHMSVPFRR